MKTIDDALELRGRIFGAFEMAERESDPVLRQFWLTFVVVGAGPTGVELAGQIAELARRSLHGNFCHIDPATARVVLLDAAPKILSTFPEPLQQRAAQTLQHPRCRDPSRRDGHRCRSAWHRHECDRSAAQANRSGDEDLGSRRRASPLARVVADAAGAKVDRAGRVQVEPDCTVPGYPEVFVIGDLMNLDGLPGLAQVAIQSGRFASETIVSRLDSDTWKRPFHYSDRGTMATISRFQAIALIGRVQSSGFIAWLLWLGVHLCALTGFKNRLAVLANWIVAFLGRGRPQRAITSQQVFARQALEAQAQALTSSGITC